ncbi:DUF2461 family protein [Cryptosporangium arvum]|uniref:DUF2461 family protein n=1 Tax=Cryptosporangium arvum TaxID=80871 RepID=UPI00055B15F4|nr:DUF2461 family protein [Cryptosporangium arvum]
MGEFAGFDAGVVAWFEGLEADNSREYFGAHRAYYEREVRGRFGALLADLAAELGGEVKVFRQHRDVRFAADKSPYKTQTYGLLTGSSLSPAGLFAAISADGLAAGTGYWRMARDQLVRYRAAVDDELAARVADAVDAGLEQWSQGLATAPRGIPRDHPRIELLRLTSVTLGRRRPAGGGIGADEGRVFVRETWRTAAPVLAWLDEHVGPSTEEQSWGRGAQRRGR